MAFLKIFNLNRPISTLNSIHFQLHIRPTYCNYFVANLELSVLLGGPAVDNFSYKYTVVAGYVLVTTTTSNTEAQSFCAFWKLYTKYSSCCLRWTTSYQLWQGSKRNRCWLVKRSVPLFIAPIREGVWTIVFCENFRCNNFKASS